MTKPIQIKNLTIGAGIPKICVPLTGTTEEKICQEAKDAKKAGADLVEWRADFFEVLSVVPGTSRSGSTIIGGILVGTSRTVAAEFTFFLGIPVMFGASLLKLLKFGFGFTGTEVLILVIGMVVAFVVSILAIKFLMGYIKKHDFKAFGWYRIVLGVLVLVYFIGKTLLA